MNLLLRVIFYQVQSSVVIESKVLRFKSYNIFPMLKSDFYL